MEESTTREKVLKKIRAALLNKTPDPYPNLDHDKSLYTQSDDDAVVVFAERFMEAGGRFVLCESELEFAECLLNLCEQHGWKNIYCGEEPLSNLLTECAFPHHYEADPANVEVAVTSCECLVASSGSIVLSSRQGSIAMPVFAPVHVVCANSSQIAIDMKDALFWLKGKYDGLPSSVSFITGPASTMQIEGVPVQQGHGSLQLYLFLIDDRSSGYIDQAPDEERF
jgi:L-lactate dehydrogenase complex protein LldG